jgi:ABC-type multidrug transport system ATPase subunit
MARRAQQPPAGDPAARLPLTRELVLEGVHFAYPAAARTALQDVSLTIPARATVGIVGGTGAGKTTLVDLILGLLTPDSGLLRVDGTVLGRDTLRPWQRTVGYVPQVIYLTDDTVAANIAFGVPPEQIDMEAVERAARIAALHDFVIEDLPQGYATRVGERGVRLSGGQRQRIGIARALYRDPTLLVMDEATSALDNLTERAVMEAVANMRGDRTIILIAHRLSTVRDCDTIFDLGMLRQQRAFAAQPTLQFLDQRSRQALPRLEAVGGGAAVEIALDFEQGVDAPDGVEGDRRNLLGVLALADVALDIGEFEELAAGVRPTQGRSHGPRQSFRVVKRIVASIGIGLENARPSLQMFCRVFTAPVAGEAEDHRRRGGATEWAVVAHIGPEPGCLRAAPGQ